MSIRRRGESWLVTVELGRDSTGCRRRHCSTHATEAAAKKAEAIARATAGSAWTDSDLVFCDPTGETWPLDGFQGSWRHLRVNAGLPAEVHFHCLRHTYATEMLLAGVHPKIVSEALGHSSVRITLDRYSHAIPHLQTEAAALMDARLRALLGTDTGPSITS